MNIKNIFLLIVLNLSFFSGYSQERIKLTYFLVNEDKNPIVGANVEIYSVTRGETNFDGEVDLYIPSDRAGHPHDLIIRYRNMQVHKEQIILPAVHLYITVPLNIVPKSLPKSAGSGTPKVIPTKSNSPKVMSAYLGHIKDSITHKPVNNAFILVRTADTIQEAKLDSDGYFRFEICKNNIESTDIHLTVRKEGYIVFNTTIGINEISDMSILDINLKQDFHSREINGRIIAKPKNNPIGNVFIKASGSVSNISASQKSLTVDNEEGKPEGYFSIITEESFTRKDEIKLELTKNRYEKYTSIVDLENITASDTVLFYMNYVSKITNLEMNSFSLTISYLYKPTDWFINLEYYRRFNVFNERFIGIGAHIGFLTVLYEDEYHTFNRENRVVEDKVYKNGLVGVSFRYWIIDPRKRFFSSYVGVSGDYTNNSVYAHPFIGARTLLGNHWALVLEFKYIYPTIEVKDCEFNIYGQATCEDSKIVYSKLSINIGVSWVF